MLTNCQPITYSFYNYHCCQILLLVSYCVTFPPTDCKLRDAYISQFTKKSVYHSSSLKHSTGIIEKDHKTYNENKIKRKSSLTTAKPNCQKKKDAKWRANRQKAAKNINKMKHSQLLLKWNCFTILKIYYSACSCEPFVAYLVTWR